MKSRALIGAQIAGGICCCCWLVSVMMMLLLLLMLLLLQGRDHSEEFEDEALGQGSGGCSR